MIKLYCDRCKDEIYNKRYYSIYSVAKEYGSETEAWGEAALAEMICEKCKKEIFDFVLITSQSQRRKS